MLAFKPLKLSFFKNFVAKFLLPLLLMALTLSVFALLYNPGSALAQYKVPFIKPMEGGIITGFRQEYYDEEEKVSRRHTGIDISGDSGARVRASGNGTVVYIGYSNIGGRTIVIRHNEKIRTTYLNITDSFVNYGQKVHQGDIIAAIGAQDDPSSGHPHLHFGIIYDGYYLDPEDVLKIDYSSISKYISLKYIYPDFKVQFE